MNHLLLFNNFELSDGFIIVLFTLFVASTVNERIIDFIKLRIPSLWLKSVNPIDEIRRHQNLWLLAFCMGIITTGLLDINFIIILIDNFEENKIEGFLKWLRINRGFFLVDGLGYIFTALFISLGSKFWHDLLDVVLFIKNSKRKLSEFNPEGIQRIEQIDNYLKEDEYEIAQKTLESHRNELEEKYKSDSMYIGYEYVDKQYRWTIVIMVRNGAYNNGHNSKQAPIEYMTNYGYIFKFPVLVKQAGLAVTTDSSNPVAKAGGGLFNSAKPSTVGTFGCIVKEVKADCKDYLLLTCCHCVRVPEEHNWAGIDQKNNKREVRYKANANDKKMPVVGEIKRGYRNGRMDIAIIKPRSNELVSDYITASGKLIPLGSRDVTKEDVFKKTRVWFSGARSGNSEGYIIHYNCTVPIHYAGDTEPHKIRNLIAFSQNPSEPHKKPCDQGDSGTIILEADSYKALGMIVAVDEKYGYAIPMSDILKTNDLALLTDPCELKTT